jgi:hypothetical protein
MYPIELRRTCMSGAPNLRRAIPAQIKSTTPNGHAPEAVGISW